MTKMITTVFNQLVISDPFEIVASKTRTRCHLQTNFGLDRVRFAITCNLFVIIMQLIVINVKYVAFCC